jgi:hypothetical protein
MECHTIVDLGVPRSSRGGGTKQNKDFSVSSVFTASQKARLGSIWEAS